MANAMTSDEAREVARARWGSTRVDHLVDELRARTADLGPAHIAAMQDMIRERTEQDQ